MQLAYLQRCPIEVNGNTIGETFKLMDGSNANATATLKARTLLAFLWDYGAVTSFPKDDWLIYFSPSIDNDAALHMLDNNLSSIPDDVVAVMPVKYMESSSNQYAVIAIRNNEDLQMIFVNSYLASSRKWLTTHKREADQLKKIIK